MLPRPATIRWSSSSSLIARLAARRAGACRSSGVEVERLGPERRERRPVDRARRSARGRASRTGARSLSATRRPRRSRSGNGRACRSRSDRPASGPTCRDGRPACRRGRCRSAHIWRGGRSPVTRAPVSRWPRSTGSARRRSGRRASTLAIRRPSSTRVKAADGGLDFGKLGHGAAIWRSAPPTPARGAAA